MSNSKVDILDTDLNCPINYTLIQALGNFIADPAYLDTIAFVQNPDLQNPLSQENYNKMVTSIDNFLLNISTLPTYSKPNGFPIAIQVVLTNANIQYNSIVTGQNTVQNVINGVLGSNLQVTTQTLLNTLNVATSGEGFGIYPSPLKPLPRNNLTFGEGFSSPLFEYRSYVSQAIYGNFSTQYINEYIPFALIIVSTPLPVTGYPLDNGWSYV